MLSAPCGAGRAMVLYKERAVSSSASRGNVFHSAAFGSLFLALLLLFLVVALAVLLSRPSGERVDRMAQQYVASRVSGDKVAVFVKRGCPYCTAAEAVLAKYRFKPGAMEVFDIGGEEMMAQIQDFFLRSTGEKTVPRVYVGEKCIGGGSDTEALERSGRLKGMLEAIGVLQ